MATTVAVLGGGVGGLSAAHELAERGFDVTVYEKRARPGGKARSYPTPDGFPAEHGFRFFPAFYRHLPDTMARIPLEGGAVRDRLVGAERILFARGDGENELLAPAHAPGVAGRPRRAGAVRARRGDPARRARGGRRLAARAPVHAAVELRRAARGAVGPARAGGPTCRPTSARRRSGATWPTG